MKKLTTALVAAAFMAVSLSATEVEVKKTTTTAPGQVKKVVGVKTGATIVHGEARGADAKTTKVVKTKGKKSKKGKKATKVSKGKVVTKKAHVKKY